MSAHLKSSFITMLILLWSSSAATAESFVVKETSIQDDKAVFATVESKNVVPARARINGTIADLPVKEGDHVEQGQVVATVGDEKIAMQINAIDSQIAGYSAQATQARAELDRLKQLVPMGAAAPTAKEKAQRDFDVAISAQKSASAQKEILRRQISEGQVLAPVSGRILKVPVTAGTVVMPGETIAVIADEHYILRLQIPERHARFIKKGNTIRIDQGELGGAAAKSGTITLVYPQIDNGRVVADADVDNIGDYFVGERVRVWVSGGERRAILIPHDYLETRYGIDYVHVKNASGTSEIAVQRGRNRVDDIEILSGIKDGDVLVQP